jgi:hypothetical protein
MAAYEVYEDAGVVEAQRMSSKVINQQVERCTAGILHKVRIGSAQALTLVAY